MEIGSAQAINVNSPTQTTRTDRVANQESDSEQNQQAAQTSEAQAPTTEVETQRVQPVQESEETQASSDNPPEADSGSQEAVGRFIDEVV